MAARVTTVVKMAFPGEGQSTLGTGLSSAANYGSGCANSGTAGYNAIGYPSGYSSTISKWAFSDDSRTTGASTLSSSRYACAAFANSGTAGYWAGGYKNASPNEQDTVDKVAFADDTRSTLGTGLSNKVTSAGGFADSGVAGYKAGGNDDVTEVAINVTDRFSFADDSRSTIATLSTNRSYEACFANCAAL